MGSLLLLEWERLSVDGVPQPLNRAHASEPPEPAEAPDAVFPPLDLPAADLSAMARDPELSRFAGLVLGAAIGDAMNALNRPNVTLYREHLRGTGAERLLADAWYVHVYREARDANLDGLAWRMRAERGVPLEVVHGAAVREVANDSLRTRAMARARWESVTLDFDIANSRWRKVLSDGTPIADQDTDAQGWKTLPEDVSFQAVPGTQDVVFQANGRVATGTSIRVLNDSGTWQLDYSELSGRVVANKI